MINSENSSTMEPTNYTSPTPTENTSETSLSTHWADSLAEMAENFIQVKIIAFKSCQR
jgi:hypothetical protein